ncbi:MAG: right-handed parallel beta-helix repeat-containing protein [Cytophagales bacterium]|nr:right-handed parallel beta-helix repeat-containing protein [Cytophagales bacterium]
MKIIYLSISLAVLVTFSMEKCLAKTYYLSSKEGNDQNDGLTPSNPWRSLEKASQIRFEHGDTLLLQKGNLFYGKLVIQGAGTQEQPIVIGSYGEGKRPIIDAAGWLAAIHIRNSRFILVSGLEIMADGGDVFEDPAIKDRYGVFITVDKEGTFGHLQLENLYIHHIFSTIQSPANGKNQASNKGMGVGIYTHDEKSFLKTIRIKQCKIETTGHTGIDIRVYTANKDPLTKQIEDVTITGNILNHIGGPGIVPRRCKNVLVRANTVSHTGSSIDARMHGRGSGIWPWGCEDVLIEHNRFAHARGKADSCGVHIDFNCKNVIVQYNLGMDNAGGFVEILGNNYNCAYRYNISINDGFRIKGEDNAQQEGKVLWTSGYVGRGKKKIGPFNSYIYNNTVYASEEIVSKLSFASTTKGLLVANNIFYLLGKTKNVTGDQDDWVDNIRARINNVVFTNNVYARAGTLPSSFSFKEEHPIVGDPGFLVPYGHEAHHFVPTNLQLLKDKSIAIKNLEGDRLGLKDGFAVEKDFFGNPIKGVPDIGAIEIQE